MMSFNAREHSIAQGQPLRLYKFRRGVLVWLYTSADRDIVIGPERYRSLRGGIIDSGIRRTGEVVADRLKITASADLEVAALYRHFPPTSEIELIIYDAHFGEPTAQVVWSGSIESVRWPSLDRCEISVLTLMSTLDVPGLRLTWERNCGTSLFSRLCKVNRDLWRADLLLQSKTGVSVSSGAAAAFADGWFDSGFLEWPIGAGEFERRAIERHVGSTLRLMGGTAGVPLASVRAYPGCDRTAAMCHTRYGNLNNLRADPNMMGKNPFDGKPIF